jgi:hypothetical protein
MKRRIKKLRAARAARFAGAFVVRGRLAQRAHLASRAIGLTPEEFARTALVEYLDRAESRNISAA